jgi:hypothetical protein
VINGQKSVVCFRARVSKNKIARHAPRLLRPDAEQQNGVLVGAATLREAERLIESCEYCNPEGAEIPFDTSLIASPGQIRARRITF